MKTGTTKIYNWALGKASSTRAPLWVALLFSFELFLFIPLDAILMFCCIQNRAKTILYVAIATLASTLSALLGYLVGNLLWDLVGSYIVPHFISHSYFDKLTLQFEQYENWAVLLGALLPFPLKAISLTAGVYDLSLAPFLLFVFIARLLRFGFIGSAIYLGGERVKGFVDRHFHRIMLMIGAKIAAAFIFFWALAN